MHLGSWLLACGNSCPLYSSFGSRNSLLLCPVYFFWADSCAPTPVCQVAQVFCPVCDLRSYIPFILSYIPPCFHTVNYKTVNLTQLSACDFENLDNIDDFLESVC